MEFCLVFTPDDPQIYTLNPSAWLILQLCDEQDEASIAAAYHAAVDPLVTRDEALREVRSGLCNLVEMKIIEVADACRRRRTAATVNRRSQLR
jgi:Coenzyme PQQ synthesis protein D (PqqD)